MNPRNRRKQPWLALLFCLQTLVLTSVLAEPNVLLWDTGAPLPDDANLAGRQDWRAVPPDLFKLEADPLKSSSDPGYYGREYAFKGDMVVENRHFMAAFVGTQGKVVLLAKSADGKTANSRPGQKIAELSPLRPGAGTGTIQKYNLLENSPDEVAGEVYFGRNGSPDICIRFTFGKSEIIQLKLEQSGLSLRAPVEYGIVPSFVGDDLIFGGSHASEADTLSVPAEHMLLALLHGEHHQLLCTWPEGRQRVEMELGPEKGGRRPISSINFQNGGTSVFIAPQSAPGIWHREELNASYLEKDTGSQWKRPFPARWQTQLLEAGVKTRFAFRDGPGTVWRGVPGSYNYPVWFDGETAFYHLGKKVSARGESIIYFVEGRETPPEIITPVDVLRSTLGWAEADRIVDLPGRKLRTHHRRGGSGVRRACTCGCTEAIQAIFESGEERARKEEIREAIEDMIYFVRAHVERIDEYRRFAAELDKFLKAKSTSDPHLQSYLDDVQQIVEQIPQEYEVQKENMKSPAYADELSAKTMKLTEKSDSGNLAAYMELLKAWRGMGGAQDYVVAQCHALTRKLFQEASSASSTQPKALELALEIRKRCREILRNADGYEIWPNY